MDIGKSVLAIDIYNFIRAKQNDIWPLKSTQRYDVIVIYERLFLNKHALF